MNNQLKEAVISFVQDMLNEGFEALEETKRATKDRIKNIASDKEGEAYKSDNTDGARKMSALAGRHGPKGGTGKKSKQAGWVRSARKASNKGKTPMQAAQDKKRRREAEAKHPNLRH